MEITKDFQIKTLPAAGRQWTRLDDTKITMPSDEAARLSICVEDGWAEYVAPAPTPEELAAQLVQQQAQSWENIKAERERRRVGGVLVAGKWFHTDDASRIQHLGLVMMGASMPAGIQWKTLDGSYIEMTPTLAGQIFNAVAGSDMANFANAEAHRLSMLAAADPMAYDYSTGWLEVYTP